LAADERGETEDIDSLVSTRKIRQPTPMERKTMRIGVSPPSSAPHSSFADLP
jgi:hypothetical protein